MITFAEVTEQVMKAGGLSAPKVLTVRGSDGNNHKIIFKVIP
jgi:phosphatidylinositol kinase/protein kinase (PI-3  family)